MTRKVFRLSWPTLDKYVIADIMLEQNNHTCEAVMAEMPIESMMGHVSIAGEGMWFPIRMLYSGPSRPLPRVQGSIYLAAATQALAIIYGPEITETAKVNQFAVVRPEYFSILHEVGIAVKERTMMNAQRECVPVYASIETEEG